MDTQFRLVSTATLQPSPLNPRKAFEPRALAELTESIRAKGILEPLLVRPTGDGRFEVAAGARRLLAAEAAGLAEVPCLVRAMTDVELLEVALLENVVRADISALEEGDTYRLLVKSHGYTVEQLVEKTGRSRSVIFARMKLAELQGDARAMLAAGKLSASVAELIARLPTTKAQEGALAKLVEKAHWRNVDIADDTGFKDLSRVPFREAKELLDEEFRLVLKEATFDTKDAELLEGVGACGECPKRTGADREAFADVKADTCLDAACWRAKTAAAVKLLKAEVKERGKELVKVGRVTDPYTESGLARTVAEKYARPTDKVDGKNSWVDLLGGLDGAAVVALDKENKTHNLVDKAKAMELLRAKDPKKAAAIEKKLAEPRIDDWKARQEAADKERQRALLVHTSLRRTALDKVKKPLDAVDLLLLARAADEYQWTTALARAGLPAKTRLEKLTPEQKARLLLSDAFTSRRDDFVEAAAKALKVDLKPLRKVAATFPPGTCFACAAKVAPEESLCTACTGDDE